MHLSLIVLPLAISFFTFQQIAYLVDAYKGELTNNGFVSYCLFVTFFPQLIAGPIVHNKEMLPQFKKGGSSRFKVDDISIGSTIFLIGLFKKTVFADNVAAYATPVFKLADSGGELMFLEAWIGAISYSLQLYFDFSGYADMAIGAGRMFGIYLPANFDSPYKATNIIDFWKKWHMTLSRFLRDYVYIAMGGNRKGNTRRAINLFLTMLIGGLWHGAGWTFVVWGGIHGVLLLVNHSWRVLYGKANFTIKLPQRFFSLMSFSLTIFIVVIAWVFFRAESLDGANNMLKTMFGMNGIVLPHQLQSILYDPYFISFSSGAFGTIAGISAMMWIFVLSAIVFIAPNTQQIMENYKPTYEYLISDKKCRPTRYSWRPNLLFAIIMAIVSVISISFVFMAERSEFLYFQF